MQKGTDKDQSSDGQSDGDIAAAKWPLRSFGARVGGRGGKALVRRRVSSLVDVSVVDTGWTETGRADDAFSRLPMTPFRACADGAALVNTAFPGESRDPALASERLSGALAFA